MFISVIVLNSQPEMLRRRRPRRSRLSSIIINALKVLIILTKGSSFATGIEVQDRRKRVLVISTGSKSVDTILGGEYIDTL